MDIDRMSNDGSGPGMPMPGASGGGGGPPDAIPWPKNAACRTLLTNYPCLTLVEDVWSIAAAGHLRHHPLSPLAFKCGNPSWWNTGMLTDKDGVALFIQYGRVVFLTAGEPLRHLIEELALSARPSTPYDAQRPCYEIEIGNGTVRPKTKDCTLTVSEVEKTVMHLIQRQESAQALRVLCKFAQTHWAETNKPVKEAHEAQIKVRQYEIFQKKLCLNNNKRG